MEQKIKAEPDAWDAECRVNPRSRGLRGVRLYWFECCNELWHGQVAKGNHVIASNDSPPQVTVLDEGTPTGGELHHVMQTMIQEFLCLTMPFT